MNVSDYMPRHVEKGGKRRAEEDDGDKEGVEGALHRVTADRDEQHVGDARKDAADGLQEQKRTPYHQFLHTFDASVEFWAFEIVRENRGNEYLSGEGTADVLRRELADEAEKAALEGGAADVDDDDRGEDEDEERALPVVGVLDEGHNVGEDKEQDDQAQAHQQSRLGPVSGKPILRTNLDICLEQSEGNLKW